MNWSEWLSVVAIGVSVASLALHWRTYHVTERRLKPVLTWSLKPTSFPDCYLLTLKLRSRDNLGWKVTAVSVRHPRNARLVNLRDIKPVRTHPNLGTGRPIEPPGEMRKRTVAAYLAVAPAGTQPDLMIGGARVGMTDEGMEHFYLFLSASSSAHKARRWASSLRILFKVASISVKVASEDDEKLHNMRIWIRSVPRHKPATSTEKP